MDCSLGLPPKTCPHCSKSFSSVKVKYRHIKRVHQVAVEGARRSLMLCPLCAEFFSLKKMDCSLGLPPKTCPHCSKSFSSVKVKYRHIKRVHQVAVEGARRSLMLCPLCADGSEVKTYEGLRKHIKENHQVNIAQLTYQFSSNQD
ncbi:hypothetical protein QE152_g25629 [Popillia japonica]|uniref:C2H2-type domain-containing protein n=1 Tax=Popillia japonica TaxID=7064 RepID=A0AAW1K1H1_POPJA